MDMTKKPAESIKDIDPDALAQAIVERLARQPLSLQQLADTVGVPVRFLKPIILRMVKEGRLKTNEPNNRLYRYVVISLPQQDDEVPGFVCSRCGMRLDEFPESGVCPRCSDQFFWVSPSTSL